MLAWATGINNSHCNQILWVYCSDHWYKSEKNPTILWVVQSFSGNFRNIWLFFVLNSTLHAAFFHVANTQSTFPSQYNSTGEQQRLLLWRGHSRVFLIENKYLIETAIKFGKIFIIFPKYIFYWCFPQFFIHYWVKQINIGWKLVYV